MGTGRYSLSAQARPVGSQRDCPRDVLNQRHHRNRPWYKGHFVRGLRLARLDKQVSRCPARSDFLKLSLLDKLEYLSICLFVSHVQQLLYITLCDDAIVLLGEFQDELLVAHLIDICLPYVSNSFSHACVHAFAQRVRPTAALTPGFNEAPLDKIAEGRANHCIGEGELFKKIGSRQSWDCGQL